MAYQTSQGLASLGRNGDSVLVHMNPTEVAGLQSLAMSQGGSLTINPDTGLPEAFSLGGLFSSILPMFAGAMFPGAGFAMEPLLAGALTGGVLAGAKGQNPLMGGLMGGLGGMSGSNLSFGLGNIANAGANIGNVANATPGMVGSTGEIGSTLMNAAKGMPVGLGPTGDVIQGYTMNEGLNKVGSSMMTNPNVVNAVQTARTAGGILPNTGSFMDKELTALSNARAGAGNLITGKPGAWQGFKDAFIDPKTGTGALSDFQAATKIGMPIGGAILGGLEPSDLYGEPINMEEAKKKQAYNPNASLNLSGDTGLRLYAEGGTIATGGIRDLYGSSDNQNQAPLSNDGYGLGRLNQLGNQQSLSQAQTLGYAMGGPVSFADGGDSNKEDALGLPSLSPDMSMSPNAGANNSAMIQSVMGAMQPTQGMQGDTSMTQGQMPDQNNDSIIAKVTANLRTDPNYQPTNPIEAAIVKQIKGNDPMQQGQPSLQGLGSLGPSQPMAPSFNPSVAMGPTYFAGMNAPRSMARGGYLNGAGDGMSDSIPATIEGKQPARLADGEFVVPADVVSHIGNGSSKAGSQRLYSMLDKVRKARTGTKKQGKQINPSKYMPA